MIDGAKWQDNPEAYYSILLDLRGSELGSVNDETYPGKPSLYEARLPYRGSHHLCGNEGPLVGIFPTLQEAKDALEAAVLKARDA